MGNSILQPGRYYHIYNRGTNSEVLFKHPYYYTEFLKLYAKYINPVAETLAYCLMSNHFHLLIRTKEVHEIPTFTELKMFENNKENLKTDKKPVASNQFAHLFSTYTLTINKAYKRTGSLFEHPFERREIDNEKYLLNCIAYIHSNPVKDGFVAKMEDYKWSSYNAMISEKSTNLDRKFVIDLYGGIENFLLYHAKDPAFFENIMREIEEEEKLQNA